MSQWEASLISKVVQEKSIREAQKRGVIADTFSDMECRNAWTYIVKCVTDVRRVLDDGPSLCPMCGHPEDD